MTVLHLHVRSKYFSDITQGAKTEEYRLLNPLWILRLCQSPPYHGIIIYKGYPKTSDFCLNNRIERIWRGWIIKKILDPEFGKDPVQVFAIRVNP